MRFNKLGAFLGAMALAATVMVTEARASDTNLIIHKPRIAVIKNSQSDRLTAPQHAGQFQIRYGPWVSRGVIRGIGLHALR